jgi:hypothetical protein
MNHLEPLWNRVQHWLTASSRDLLVVVAGGLLVLLIAWLVRCGVILWSRKHDMSKVHVWLRENTKDEPGESHRSIAEISSGTRLSEARVEAACLADPRIYRFKSEGKPDTFSVWRPEPQSVYEKRGPKWL